MEGDDILERLRTGVPFGPRMFEEMADLSLAARAEIERLRTRIAEIDRSTAAMGYLIRNVIEPLSPGTQPAPDLMGVCVQVGEMVAQLHARAEAAEQEQEALLSALAEIACTRDDQVDGLREIAHAAISGHGAAVPT